MELKITPGQVMEYFDGDGIRTNGDIDTEVLKKVYTEIFTAIVSMHHVSTFCENLSELLRYLGLDMHVRLSSYQYTMTDFPTVTLIY